MLFLIRETLLVNWSKNNISVFKADSNTKAVVDENAECKDFKNCEYCKAEKAARKKAAKAVKKSD